MSSRSRNAKRPQRVLLVSDTHGHVDPRIADLAASCDFVVHAGDVGAQEVIESLRPASGRVYAVRGNNDTPQKWTSGRAALRMLPEEVMLDLHAGTMVATHGDQLRPASRRHERLRALYPHARAVVYGHTHRLICDQSAVPWILNPGAAGRTRTYGGPSCLLVEAGSRGWRVKALHFPVLPAAALHL